MGSANVAPSVRLLIKDWRVRYRVTSRADREEIYMPCEPRAWLMETGCRFGIQYTPTKRRDPVLMLHVRNCEDCQGEVLIFD